MNTKEDTLLSELQKHYSLAEDDLVPRSKQFDVADELFRSYLNEDTWPYQSLIFSPRIFTAIFEKTSRLIGTKPKGRLVPREGGDVLGAKINNEILSFQWDDASRIDGEPLIAKWAQLDMNARKYGASFAVVKWQYTRRIEKDSSKEGEEPKYKSVPYFDGPGFQVLNNRDVLYNPSYSTIKNWIQVREYLTLNELMATNDSARGEPIYKNLDELREEIKKGMKTVNRRDSNYTPRGKAIKGLSDHLGEDETNKTIEIVTEYRDHRWITFAPKQGVIIRDVDNPYKHQQIPIVCLKYYPIDDDLYGLSEIEPVEKLQKALNAISSQYVDAINMELYKPVMVDSTRVRMHTLEFGPAKKWIVTGDPATAIRPYDTNVSASIAAFRQTYSMLVGEMQEALGETSSSTGQQDAATGGDRTATEIRDLDKQRLARDNFNQIFLSEAIKKQMMFWHSMNQQFYFEEGDTSKVIRLVDKDSIAFFEKAGYGEQGLSEDVTQQLIDAQANDMNIGNPEEFMEPVHGVETPEGMMPKLNKSQTGVYGELLVEPQDLWGNYDYIADIESMMPPNNEQLLRAKQEAIGLAKDPAVIQQLALEQKQIKLSELMEDYFEQLGFKDAGKYFGELPVSPMMPNGQIDPNTGQPIAGGAEGAQGIPGAGVPNQMQGMGIPQLPLNAPNPELMAGPQVG